MTNVLRCGGLPVASVRHSQSLAVVDIIGNKDILVSGKYCLTERDDLANFIDGLYCSGTIDAVVLAAERLHWLTIQAAEETSSLSACQHNPVYGEPAFTYHSVNRSISRTILPLCHDLSRRASIWTKATTGARLVWAHSPAGIVTRRGNCNHSFP